MAVTPLENHDIDDMLRSTTPEHERVVELLQEAATRGVSDEERYDQMVSFTMSMLPRKCSLTRAKVEEILAKRKWA